MEDEVKLEAITQELAKTRDELGDRQQLLATARQQAADYAAQAERLEEDLRLQRKKGRRLGGKLAKERSCRAEEGKRLRGEISGLRSELIEARGAEASAVEAYRASEECRQEKVAFAAPMYAEAGRGVLERVLQEYPGLDLSFLGSEGFLGAVSPVESPEAEASVDEAPEARTPGKEEPGTWEYAAGTSAAVAATDGALVGEAGVSFTVIAPGEASVIVVLSDEDLAAEASQGGDPLDLLEEPDAAPEADPAEASPGRREGLDEPSSPGPCPLDPTPEDAPETGDAAQDPSETFP